MSDHDTLRCVKQTGNGDCGPAALATVALHHGLDCSLAAVRTLSGTNAAGSSLLGLLRAAKKLGFNAQGVRANREALNTVPLPCIALSDRNPGDHFVVLFSNAGDGTFRVGDPMSGRVTAVPEAEFLASWKGVLLLLSPGWRMRRRSSHDDGSLGWLRLQSGAVALALVLTTMSTLCSLLPSLYLQYVIDRLIPRRPDSMLTLVTLGVLAAMAARSASQAGMELLLARIGKNLQVVLQRSLVDHLFRLPLSAHLRHTVGELLTRLNETQSVRYALVDAKIEIAAEVILLLGAAVAMLIYNPFLAVLGLLAVPMYALVLRVGAPALTRIQREVSEITAQLGEEFCDAFGNTPLIKAYQAEGVHGDRLGNRITALQGALLRARFATGLRRAIGTFLSTVIVIALTLVGAREVSLGRLSLGQLAGFFGLIGLLLSPLERLLHTITTRQEGRVAVERTSRLLAEPVEETTGDHSATLRGAVRLQEVTFRYSDDGSPVLHDVNVDIGAGKMVGIVGRSGCGKTTLLSLIAQQMQPTGGQLAFDGIEAAGWDLTAVRRQIALVPQDCQVLNTTIRENILMGRAGWRERDLQTAVRLAGLTGFLAQLPSGLDSMVGERGARVSGGERQRIALARAFLARPAILLLDEPTSALDAMTELLVRESLKKIDWNCTVVIATHRPAVIWDCDLIVVMDGGRVVECGTRQDVLRRGGLLYQFLEEQAPIGVALA
jgi:ATP-binding cassette subfamily B protein